MDSRRSNQKAKGLQSRRCVESSEIVTALIPIPLPTSRGTLEKNRQGWQNSGWIA